MTVGLQLGRPGIYQATVRRPQPLTQVRLDVAGFVGVALRGPVNVPTPVISWADYERRFGGLEPNISGRHRMLPYAVQAFFAQGGQRAVIVRVAPPENPDQPSAAEATATFRLGQSEPDSLLLSAADEGAWGSTLEITLQFVVGQTVTAGLEGLDRLRLPTREVIAHASLLRIRYADAPRGVLRWARLVDEPALEKRVMSLDEPLPKGQAADWTAPKSVTVEVITGTLTVVDPAIARRERISGLGLDPAHARYPSKILPTESLLVQVRDKEKPQLRPNALLTAWQAVRRNKGADRSDRINSGSFFDPGEAGDNLVDAELLDEQLEHRGVDLLGRNTEIGILCVPDLTWRSQQSSDQTPTQPPRPLTRWRRTWCCPPAAPESEPTAVPAELPSMLDGRDAAELDEIISRQRRVVDVAALWRRFIALLDVPAGLPTSRITEWRAAFDSSFAAAYHPWLGVPHPDRSGPGTAVLLPPSAFAAGIIADRERRLGLSRGPANQLALGAVVAADPVSDALADQLHLLSINVFWAERDGFRLGAARTLSSDRDYRQLSVRRLMTMLALTLQRYGEGFLVFEPNTSELRARLSNAITELLRDLHRRGAFKGATEEQSFFVRCNDSTNTPQSQALGRLVAEIGVAPAEPLEYLVLRIASDGEGGLLVEEQGGGARSASPEGLEVPVV
jgi:uncharacterized protein